MSKAVTTDEVAAELRTALEGGAKPLMEALGARYAEKVEIVHEPPVPQDGVIDGDVLRAHGSTETAAMEKAMPDFNYGGPVTVDGDDVTVDAHITGTVADGTELDANIATTYTIKDGEVVRIFAKLDMETMQKLMKALSAGGFEIPGA